MIAMFTKLCPQNEKEEALTTNVWIEMVTFGGPFLASFKNTQFMHSKRSQTCSVSVCSNGATTG